MDEDVQTYTQSYVPNIYDIVYVKKQTGCSETLAEKALIVTCGSLPRACDYVLRHKI